MKKVYINPKLTIVNVQTEHFLADSLHSMSTSGGSVEVSDTELGSGIAAEGRSSFWDED